MARAVPRTVFFSSVFQLSQVFQHFAKSRWASFVPTCQTVPTFCKESLGIIFQTFPSQVVQQFAKNRWASFSNFSNILNKILVSKRFFAECWKSWKSFAELERFCRVGKMMPNDSLQNVWNVGTVEKWCPKFLSDNKNVLSCVFAWLYTQGVVYIYIYIYMYIYIYIYIYLFSWVMSYSPPAFWPPCKTSWREAIPILCSTCWKSWKHWKMMPNDSLHNVGKVGKVEQMMPNDSLQTVGQLGLEQLERWCPTILCRMLEKL